MKNNYHITFQGIDENFHIANGSYEPIDYNNLTKKQAEKLISKFMKIKDNLDYSKDDLCPPSFSIRFGNKEVFSFYLNNTKLLEVEFQQEYSIEKILELIQGKIKFDERILKSKKYKKEEIFPLRQKNILPTKDDLKNEEIDISQSSKQFSELLWKSRSWMETTYALPFSLAIFFLFIGLILLGEKRDADLAPDMFMLAGISALLFFPLLKFGKKITHYGVDWKTNTVWIKRGKKIIGFIPDANYVKDFIVFKSEEVQSNPMWIMEPASPMYFKKREWLIQFLRQGRDFYWTFPGSALATRKEATLIRKRLNELLGINNLEINSH